MKLRFVFLILFFCSVGSAESVVSTDPKLEANPWHFNLFPLNAMIRYERDSSQQLAERRLQNLALGARKGPHTWLLEYSRFSDKTGNASLSTERKHEEYIFWWKQNILNLELADFFISGGGGAYQESVVRSLVGSEDDRHKGDFQVMGGLSAGVQSQLFRYLLLSFEGRIIAGRNLDPNPQADLLVRLGVEF